MFSLRSVSFSRRLAAGAVALAMVLAVSSRKALGGPPDKAVAASLPATPPGHGLDTADMDTTCKPCEDFYKYADGGWLKKNPIPPEYPSWGTFSELAERNRTALRKILERLAADKSAAPGSEEQKIGDFYASCMDEAAIEAQGARPLAPELERIEKIRNLADLEVELAYLQTHGVNA